MATTPETGPGAFPSAQRGDAGLWLWMVPCTWLLFDAQAAERFSETSRWALVTLSAMTVGAWPKRGVGAGALWWWAALVPFVFVAWWLERNGEFAVPGSFAAASAGGLALAVAWGACVPQAGRGWAYAWFGLAWWAPILLALWREGARLEAPALDRLIEWGPACAAWRALQGGASATESAWHAGLVLGALAIGVHVTLRRRS